VIEDAAQSLGADYRNPDGSMQKGGTIGVIGTTSFFPSKSLGAFGDGGAMITRDNNLAVQLRMISNHGQRKKYQHDTIGVNSRLDTLQASILKVKLKYLNEYASKRQKVAEYYNSKLKSIPFLKTPIQAPYSTHVFHQYTIRTIDVERNKLKLYLEEKGIPSMIYYPIPLHRQPAYQRPGFGEGAFPITERLSRTVLSLPIHTEMDEEQLSYICDTLSRFS
jgi:dTDP-4-amino-4,6-dideoxygalactose transaminase